MRLRIALLATVAVPICSVSATAQSAPTVVGPVLGVNLATLSGSDVTDASSRTGFAFGVQLQHRFQGGGFLRTGLVYSMRGASASDLGVKVTFKENYIELPVLLGYRFPMEGQTRPFLMAGAQVGFKASCKIEASSGGTSASVNCDDSSIGGNFSSTDFALVGGGGVTFSMARGMVSVDARYTLGLQNIEQDTKAKNRGLTLAVSYMMPLGGR